MDESSWTRSVRVAKATYESTLEDDCERGIQQISGLDLHSATLNDMCDAIAYVCNPSLRRRKNIFLQYLRGFFENQAFPFSLRAFPKTMETQPPSTVTAIHLAAANAASATQPQTYKV